MTRERTLALGLLLFFSAVFSEANSTTTFRGGAFIGGGSQVSTFSANSGAQSYSLMLSSGLSLGLGGLSFSTGPAQESGEGPISTTTVIPVQSSTITTLGPCLQGSTVSFVAAGPRFVDIFLNGFAIASSTVAVAVLHNGGPFPEYGTSAALLTKPTHGVANVSFSFSPRGRLTAGTHYFCVQMAPTTGSASLGNNNGSARFGVAEIK